MNTTNLLAWSTPLTTLGLLLVTIAYSYFTYQLADVGRRQRFESVRPRLHIAVVATQNGQFFVLRIENVGLSPALNLKLILDRKVCRAYGHNELLNDVPFLKNGVPAFMPNTPVEIGLGVSHTYLGPDVDRAKHPARFEVTATYEFEKRQFRESFPLEINDLYGETVIAHTEIGDLIKTLKEDLGSPIKQAVQLLKSK